MRRFIVYSTERCPWCRKVIALIEEKAPDATISVRTLTGPNCEHFRFMQDMGLKTVPQVFIDTGGPDSKLIGGYEATAAYFDELAKTNKAA